MMTAPALGFLAAGLLVAALLPSAFRALRARAKAWVIEVTMRHVAALHPVPPAKPARRPFTLAARLEVTHRHQLDPATVSLLSIAFEEAAHDILRAIEAREERQRARDVPPVLGQVIPPVSAEDRARRSPLSQAAIERGADQLQAAAAAAGQTLPRAAALDQARSMLQRLDDKLFHRTVGADEDGAAPVA